MIHTNTNGGLQEFVGDLLRDGAPVLVREVSS
jgi:hypothetical protein